MQNQKITAELTAADDRKKCRYAQESAQVAEVLTIVVVSIQHPHDIVLTNFGEKHWTDYPDIFTGIVFIFKINSPYQSQRTSHKQRPAIPSQRKQLLCRTMTPEEHCQCALINAVGLFNISFRVIAPGINLVIAAYQLLKQFQFLSDVHDRYLLLTLFPPGIWSYCAMIASYHGIDGHSAVSYLEYGHIVPYTQGVAQSFISVRRKSESPPMHKKKIYGHSSP